jgi:hypothetical protein
MTAVTYELSTTVKFDEPGQVKVVIYKTVHAGVCGPHVSTTIDTVCEPLNLDGWVAWHGFTITSGPTIRVRAHAVFTEWTVQRTAEDGAV